MRTLMLALTLMVGHVVATGAHAQGNQEENLALIIGNFDYEAMEDVPGEADVSRMRNALQDAGFRVIRGTDLTTQRQIGVSRLFAERLDRADRVMVIVLGHVVSSEDDSFLLGVDARRTDVLNAGNNGLSLTALQSLLSQRPGTAILMVAGNRSEPSLGRGIKDGFRGNEVKQGVTVVRGGANALSQVLIDGLLEPGNSIRQALPERSGLRVTGFVSDRVSFMGAGAGDEVSPDLGQLAYWNATRDIGSKEAYEAYLKRFPKGIFAGEAKAVLEDLRLAPLREAKAKEDAMNLSRSARRTVQQALTNLGFNTRGVDGIFGRGTRAAISNWQKSSGYKETGYLTPNQYRELRDKQAEIDAAAEAQAEQAARVERTVWEAAKNDDSIRAYRRYLRQYPNGRFEREARRRIAELNAPRDNGPGNSDNNNNNNNNSGGVPANAAAAQQERVFAPNQLIRLAIERQLARNGFNPGQVDGKFTGQTRRAIAGFQDSRGLPVTGYANAATVSLLAL